MKKDYLKQVGYVSELTDVLNIKRLGKPDINKRTFTFTSLDGQKCYPEVRNSKLNILDYIRNGDRVEMTFVLQGSEKNNKKYNNVLINSIKPV